MFVYFDLGNVLLNFDHDLMCRKMAAVVQQSGAAASAEDVKAILFESRPGRPALEWRYERGEISTEEFLDEFSQAVGAKPDASHLAKAASEIFTANVSVRAVLGALLATRQPLGLLSNTNAVHWEYIAQRKDMLIPSAFRVLALSFELGCMKPEAEIFAKAAELAGVAPQEIFYVDDIAGHVSAARAAGFHAVQYTSTPQLVDDLRACGIALNY